MRIITHTCPDCGTIVGGNVLERNREFRCPGLECDSVLRFSDLPTEEREHLLENHERYTLD